MPNKLFYVNILFHYQLEQIWQKFDINWYINIEPNNQLINKLKTMTQSESQIYEINRITEYLRRQIHMLQLSLSSAKLQTVMLNKQLLYQIQQQQMSLLKARNPHNNIQLQITSALRLKIGSDFDGGNLQSATIKSISDGQDGCKFVSVQLSPALQPFNPQYSNRQSSKTFFNFSICLVHVNTDQKQDQKQVPCISSGMEIMDTQNLAYDRLSAHQQGQTIVVDGEANKARNQEYDKDSSESDNYSRWQMNQSIPNNNNTIELLEQMVDKYQRQGSQKSVLLENEEQGQQCSSQIVTDEQNNSGDECISQHNNLFDGIYLIFYIKRMNVPNGLNAEAFQEYYRPCIGRKKGLSKFEQPVYQKFKPQNMKLLRNNQQLTMRFLFAGTNFNSQTQEDNSQKNIQSQTIYFSYHYPYSNDQLRSYLLNIENKVNVLNSQNIQNFIYLRNQFAIKSLEGRAVNLVTLTLITDKIESRRYHKSGQIIMDMPRQPRISKDLFPYYDSQLRPYKFQKPYCMFTCRVHPGQTSGSYALEGMINKLLDGSKQSQFLLKSFTFVIIPILNPDGVYNGTYRMDLLGQNLNRFYDIGLPHKQPSIFAAQNLLHYYSSSLSSINSSENSSKQDSPVNMLAIFIDIHAHAKVTTPFIYGNAYSNITEQAESQLFVKFMEKYSSFFAAGGSSFSQKNMNSKDAVQLMSKNGSARLCAFRLMKGFIHCYTLQMGYIGCPVTMDIQESNMNKCEQLQQLSPLKKNPNLTIITSDKLTITKFKHFTIDDYRQTGAAVIQNLSNIYKNSIILLSSQNNKCINFQKQQQQKLQSMRQQLVKQIFVKQDRLRLKQNMFGKLKNITTNVLNSIYAKILKHYPQIQEFAKDFVANNSPNTPKLCLYRIKPKKNAQILSDAVQKNYRSLTPMYKTPEKKITQLKERQSQYLKLMKQNQNSQSRRIHGKVDNKQLYIYDEKVKQRVQQKGKIFKNTVSVTPIKFKVQQSVRKNIGNNINIRRMIQFYSGSLSKDDSKKMKYIRNLRKINQIKLKGGQKQKNLNQVGKKKVVIKIRQSVSENKPSYHKTKAENSTIQNKGIRVQKETLINYQISQKMQDQGFSFNLLQGVQSQKKLQDNNQQRYPQTVTSSEKQRQIFSYRFNNTNNNINTKNNSNSAADTYPTHTHVAEGGKRHIKTPNINHLSYLLPHNQMVNRNIKTRQTMKTPPSSFGFICNHNGLVEVEKESDGVFTQGNNYQFRGVFLPKLELLKDESKKSSSHSVKNNNQSTGVSNKYEIQLKIKQKYDKKYKIQYKSEQLEKKPKQILSIVNVPSDR